MLTGCFAVLLLTVFPIAFGPAGYADITTTKFVVFLGIALLYVLAMLAARIFAAPQWQAGASPWRISIGQWLLLAMLGWLLLTALASGNFQQTILGMSRYQGLLLMLLYVLTALLVSRFGSWRQHYLTCIAVVVLLQSGLAVWQLCGGNPLGLYPGSFNYYDGNVLYGGLFLGFIGNIDFFSGYYCLMLPLLLGGCVCFPGRLRWLWLLAAVAGCSIMVVMQVASGILALLATLFILLPCYLPARWRKLAICLLIALVLLALAAVYVCGDAAPGTIGELNQVLHGQISDEFGSSRILLWKDAFDEFDSWLLGTGPGTRMSHFSTLFSRQTADGLQIEVAVDSAHNEYIDDLLELGIPGLLQLLAIFFFAARNTWQQAKDQPWRLVVAGGVLCYAMQAFFNLRIVIIAPLFWLLLGLLLIPAQAARAVTDPAAEPKG